MLNKQTFICIKRKTYFPFKRIQQEQLQHHFYRHHSPTNHSSTKTLFPTFCVFFLLTKQPTSFAACYSDLNF